MSDSSAKAPDTEGSARAAPEDAGMRGSCSADALLDAQLSLYEVAVDVQKHFNDIEWRIRGSALTVATFALGAASFAAKDGSTIAGLSQGTIVLLAGLTLWYAFYYVDHRWYHPLLKGAVDQGTDIERVLRRTVDAAGMTDRINNSSPQSPSALQRMLIGTSDGRFHSEHKLQWFYLVGGAPFVVGALGLQVIQGRWDATLAMALLAVVWVVLSAWGQVRGLAISLLLCVVLLSGVVVWFFGFRNEEVWRAFSGASFCLTIGAWFRSFHQRAGRTRE